MYTALTKNFQVYLNKELNFTGLNVELKSG